MEGVGGSPKIFLSLIEGLIPRKRSIGAYILQYFRLGSWVLLEVRDVLCCENIFIITIVILVIIVENHKWKHTLILPHKLRRRNMYRGRRGSDIRHFGEIGFQN